MILGLTKEVYLKKLRQAIRQGFYERFRYLLSASLSVEDMLFLKQSKILHYAIMHGRENMAFDLLNKGVIYAEYDADGYMVHHRALLAGMLFLALRLMLAGLSIDAQTVGENETLAELAIQTYAYYKKALNISAEEYIDLFESHINASSESSVRLCAPYSG